MKYNPISNYNNVRMWGTGNQSNDNLGRIKVNIEYEATFGKI